MLIFWFKRQQWFNIILCFSLLWIVWKVLCHAKNRSIRLVIFRMRGRSAVGTPKTESDMNQKPLRTWTVRDTLRNPPLHTLDGSGLRRRLMVKLTTVKVSATKCSMSVSFCFYFYSRWCFLIILASDFLNWHASS